MTNAQIAISYADKMYASLNDGGVWISAKPALPRKELDIIIGIYKRRFKSVKIDGNTIVCVK